MVKEVKFPGKGVDQENSPDLGVKEGEEECLDGKLFSSLQGKGSFKRLEKLGPFPVHLLVIGRLNRHVRLNPTGQDLGDDQGPLLRKPGENKSERPLVKLRPSGQERERNTVGPVARRHLPSHGNVFSEFEVRERSRPR
jgi:hypothetical protein